MQTTRLDVTGRAAQAIALALAFSMPLSFTLPAQAFEVTEAQKEACTPDAFRLCSAEIPDANRVAVCMDANVANLSPACRAVFQPVGARAETRPDTHRRVRKIMTSYEHRHRHVARDADGKWARD
jgi:hypothetical protein